VRARHTGRNSRTGTTSVGRRGEKKAHLTRVPGQNAQLRCFPFAAICGFPPALIWILISMKDENGSMKTTVDIPEAEEP
jgi:hypothetical protein